VLAAFRPPATLAHALPKALPARNCSTEPPLVSASPAPEAALPELHANRRD